MGRGRGGRGSNGKGKDSNGKQRQEPNPDQQQQQRQAVGLLSYLGDGQQQQHQHQQQQQQHQQQQQQQQQHHYPGQGGAMATLNSNGARGKGGRGTRNPEERATRRQAPPPLQGEPANGAPPSVYLPSAAVGPQAISIPAAAAPGPYPITPLGLPRTPPALPPFPAADLFPPLPLSMDEVHESAEGTHAKQEEPWTPVAEQMERAGDRRTFFHTAGKSLTFHQTRGAKKLVSAEDNVAIGEHVTLSVEEIHFGNPRVGILKGEPAPMPQMLKWQKENFDEHELELAQIPVSADSLAWTAVGIRSNRLLYAMKRQKMESAAAVVVEPPPVEDPEEDVELTYGNSIQGIQLVP